MKHLLPLLFFFVSLSTFAQMNNDTLENLLSQQVDSLVGVSGKWQVIYKELPMMVITDETNDRMRIIAPIIEVNKVGKEVILDCLAANFHTALDVKYALSNDIIWSVFIHPLSPLSEEELKSAVEQVYFAAGTFGSTYTSTPLMFGGAHSEEKDMPKMNLKKT